MSVYEDLLKRANKLVKKGSIYKALDWGKEAASIKAQARREREVGRLSFEQMCQIVHIVTMEDELQ